MKYIINKLFEDIKTQWDRSDKFITVRVEGINDLEIYAHLANQLKTYCENNEINLMLKMSREKEEAFRQNPTSKELLLLENMKSNGFLSSDALTKARNYRPHNDEKVMIIVLGAELIPDKGGLKDFYHLSLNTIEKSLRERYSNVFDVDFNSDELSVVDLMYKSLFKLVPFNLYELSKISDEWQHDAGTIYSINDFITLFFESLHRYGLVNQKISIPTIAKIKKWSKTNYLVENYKFSNRDFFSTMSVKKITKLEEKINNFPIISEDEDLIEEWENDDVSIEEFKQCLINYMNGKNIKENFALLQKVDYYFISKLIKYKEKNETKESATYTGAPLEVFLSAIGEMIIENDQEIDNVLIVIQEIKLITDDAGNGDSGNESLIRQYQNLCSTTNGIIRKLNEENIFQTEEEIEIAFHEQTYFDIQNVLLNIESGLVKSPGSSESVNKVKFTIVLRVQEEAVEKRECTWAFSNDASWFKAYDDLIDIVEEINEDHEPYYLPILFTNRFAALANSNSEKEFLDELKEIDFTYVNAYSFYETQDEIIAGLSNGMDKLAKCFNLCIKAILMKGYYNAEIEINELISAYVNLGEHIFDNKLGDTHKWFAYIYIYLFTILNNKYGVGLNNVDSVIVPPWHPATLQKQIHKTRFLLDGVSEWWNEETVKTKASMNKNFRELDDLSMITQTLDIFTTNNIRGNDELIGNTHTFGSYSIYGTTKEMIRVRMQDILRKDQVFDENFQDSEYKYIDADSRIYFDVYQSFTKAFPNRKYELTLSFVNPSNLKPIVSSIHNYINDLKKEQNGEIINISITIFVSKNNRGGKSYLLYWINNFFADDEKINIKIYLKDYERLSDVQSMLKGNDDIIFGIDLLEESKIEFMENVSINVNGINANKYPMVYRPTPNSFTSIDRKVEITQTQFEASKIHSDVINMTTTSIRNNVNKTDGAVKVMKIRGNVNEVKSFHNYAYWVVCIDEGIDGGLLRNVASEEFSVIGYSTGKGNQGQYNITITVKQAIKDQIKRNFKYRLKQLFNWNDTNIEEVATYCMEQATKLDGISLLSAINQKDYNINEFMAYILSFILMSKDNADFKVLIHLDSYKHWFTNNKQTDLNSRPDFLEIKLFKTAENKVKLHATVIECKIAKNENREAHVYKAIGQVKNGIEVLKSIFDPENQTIKNRYWFAQLYRALAFSQITFNDNEERFLEISSDIKQILNGTYEIEFNGKVYGFWLDSDEVEQTSSIEEVSIGDDFVCAIECIDFPQVKIQSLLTQKGTNDLQFNKLSNDIFLSIEDEESYEKEYQNLYDEMDEEDQVESKPISLSHENNNSQNQSNHREDSNEDSSLDNESLDDSITINHQDDKTDQKVEDDTPKAIQDVNTMHSQEQDENQSMPKTNDLVIQLGVVENTNEKVNWDFDGEGTNNRHALITGSSGSGKTYLIENMLDQVINYGTSAVIFDYTDGFTRNHLQPEFLSSVDQKFYEHVVFHHGIPLNPFKQYRNEVAGIICEEQPYQVADRLADIFTNVFSFGAQQRSALYEAIKDVMTFYKEKASFEKVKKKLMEGNSTAKSVASKITPFIDAAKFNTEMDYDWKSLNEGEAKLFVVQLTGLSKDIQVIITEMMLWNAWYYFKLNGSKEKPFVVVLDEAQNLDHGEKSPTAKILTEGRKFGWGAWFATQFLTNFKEDEISRLQNASLKIYFKPVENEIQSVAKRIDQGNPTMWTSKIQSLRKGHCIVLGAQRGNLDITRANKPIMTRVTSFKERLEND